MERRWRGDGEEMERRLRGDEMERRWRGDGEERERRWRGDGEEMGLMPGPEVYKQIQRIEFILTRWQF